MDYQEALFHAKAGQALLFYGSGMSSEVIGINGKKMPLGYQLSHLLSKELGYSESEYIDNLEDSSQLYIEELGEYKLIELLKDIFTTKNVPEYYEWISKNRWRSIFTTNYDDSLEYSSQQNSISRSAVGPLMNNRDYPPSNDYIIHVNGYIKDLTQDTLQSSFKLTQSSYLADQFIKSKWYQSFYSEVMSCKVIFFVGYSLKADFDIKKLFFEFKSDLKSKVFFITNKQDKILQKFGTICDIGVEQFARDLFQYKNIEIDDREYSITNFQKHLEVKSREQSINVNECTFKFLTLGHENPQLLEDVTWRGLNDFAISRQKERIEQLHGFDYIFMHGDLGVGKSIFAKQLANHLLKEGYDVYFLKDDFYKPNDDIDHILSSQKTIKVAFVLDINFYTSQVSDLLLYFTQKLRKNIDKLVVVMRDDNYEEFYTEIVFRQRLIESRSITEINASLLTNQEFNDFKDILEKNALLKKDELQKLYPNKVSFTSKSIMDDLKKDSKQQLNHLLLSLFNTPNISKKYNSIFEVISNDKDLLEIIIYVFSLNILGKKQQISKSDIFNATENTLILDSSFSRNAALKPLFFDYSDSFISPKSVLFAEFFFKKFAKTELLVELLIKIAKKMYDLDQRSLYKSFATYTNIQKMLPDEQKRANIIKYYEGLRSIPQQTKNPHFWLQYAIARLAYANIQRDPNLELAEKYLDTALKLAESIRKRRKYFIYDIQTQLARVHIMKAEQYKSVDPSFQDHLNTAIKLLNEVTESDPKRASFRPLESLCKVIDKKIDVLGNDRELYNNLILYKKRIERASQQVKEELSVQISYKALQQLTKKFKFS
ncbi:SIR2 family protein [Neisseria sp. 74A18]|uniref:SIR2 family protein n=1 Tax=Neisseria sp. 74A18 TaxID=1696094 RepID=UPI0006CAED00|nr:SIR2 family protein [Neisseria sp. 74A18]KPN74255.1 hypothetical protein AKG43_03325 [Neisseria sp. 74A18]